MALSDFSTMWSTGVTVTTPTTTISGYGLRTFSTSGTTYPARVVFAPTQTVDDRGNQVTARATAWIATTSTTVNAAAQILLPDGTTPGIINVERPTDESGVHHVKVMFA